MCKKDNQLINGRSKEEEEKRTGKICFAYIEVEGYT